MLLLHWSFELHWSCGSEWSHGKHRTHCRRETGQRPSGWFLTYKEIIFCSNWAKLFSMPHYSNIFSIMPFYHPWWLLFKQNQDQKSKLFRIEWKVHSFKFTSISIVKPNSVVFSSKAICEWDNTFYLYSIRCSNKTSIRKIRNP